MAVPILCAALAVLLGSVAAALAQPAPPPPPAPPAPTRPAQPPPRPAPTTSGAGQPAASGAGQPAAGKAGQPAAGKAGQPAAGQPAPAQTSPRPNPPSQAQPRPAAGQPANAPKPPVRPPAPAVIPAPAPVPEPAAPAAPTKGSHSGLPLPRFGALKSDEVYLRTGPGSRYPIDWVYKRRDLPLEIEREFDVWRLVRDSEGTRGWVNTQTMSNRRTAVVMGAERALRREARDDAPAVARLKPGVIVRVRSCAAGADWCQASVGDYRGWLKRSEMWGTYPGEAIP